jgi:hypothetical protein
MVMVILLYRDADDNARVTAQLSVENSHRFDALNQAAVAAICVVVPACEGDSGSASLVWGPAWARARIPAMVILSQSRGPRY